MNPKKIQLPHIQDITQLRETDMDKRLISHYFHVVYRKRRVNYYPRYPISIDNAQLDISNI